MNATSSVFGTAVASNILDANINQQNLEPHCETIAETT